MLNFGHCFGHAIESAARYEIPHGQAVVLGMLLARIVARERGLLSDEFYQFIMRELLLPSLAVKVRNDHFDPCKRDRRHEERQETDRHWAGPRDDGRQQSNVQVNDLTEQEAGKALDIASDQLR